VTVNAVLIDWIAEATEPLGSLSKRAMMGVMTLYSDGIVFAIIANDQLWFKADSESDAVWDAEGCPRFTFEMKGKTGSMNYRRAPDDVHDDADAMLHWAKLALGAGSRAAARKKPRKTKLPS
jgi:DNA transformation protein and related proteins